LVKPGEDYVATLTVNPAGEIDVPSIGAVKVAGQRADEIEKTLIPRVAKVLRDPELRVRVDRAANANLPAPDDAGLEADLKQLRAHNPKERASPAVMGSAQRVFDGMSFVGLTADQVRKHLGAAHSEERIAGRPVWR